MDKIAVFMETGAKGEEMVLGSELSSFDRRLVHEFAEQSGLGHKSKGRDGIDRKIVLWIQKESPPAILARQETSAPTKSDTSGASLLPQTQVPNENDDDAASVNASKTLSSFSALALDDDSDSDESRSGDKPKAEEPVPGLPAANSLLAQLAKERAERQQQQHKKPDSAGAGSQNKKKKKKKPKVHRLGGTKTPAPPKEDDNLYDLDDMAFLDAQIEKSQNTHGRKVVGNGKNYRTVVNGILNSKPVPQSKPTNNRASAALRSKLSQAENTRKKKKKKK
jgi:hypothetical protein